MTEMSSSLQIMDQPCRVFRPWNGQLPRRVLVIANPLAGRGASLGLVSQLRDTFHKAGIGCTVSMTDEAGHATALAAQARDEVDLIAVVGGDGTVNEVLQAVGSERPAVLIVPAGTENVLAKYLGLTSSPRRLWDVVREGWAVRFDLGLIGPRRFSMLASVGFDAAIVHALHAERSGNITHLNYFWPLWRQFWQYDWPVLSVMADEREVFRGRGMIVVGNISRYALGLRICSEAMPTDGLLDLFVMECESRWELLKWATAVATRMHNRLRQGVSVRARRIRIVSAGGKTTIPVEVDGDPAGMLPAEISVVPAAATLLCWRCAKDQFANGSSQ
jgi:diacylglycerol kinase family enzyme